MKFAKKMFHKIKNSLNRDINARLDILQLLHGRELSYKNRDLVNGGGEALYRRW